MTHPSQQPSSTTAMGAPAASRPRRQLHGLGVLSAVPLVFAAVLLTGCTETETTTGTTTTATTSTLTTSTPTTTTTTTTSTYAGYACGSSLIVNESNASAMHRKGLAVDDTTFSGCADELVGLWPHTGERVTSLRIFAAWKPWWNESQRLPAWQRLEAFVKENKAKVLMGAEVTCNPSEDNQMWQWALQLMQRLGKENVMGVSIGNEVDNQPMDCIKNFWKGAYWKLFQERVDDMDKIGFTDTKVTIVWSMSVLASHPWKKAPQDVNLMITNAYRKYGKRWVWTVNPYAIWDSSQRPVSHADCAAKISGITSLAYTSALLAATRRRMKETTGNDDDTLWIGETGWSAPRPSVLPDMRSFCPDFFSIDTFQKFYRMILSWDLSVPGVKGPDHVFYFTMRDSSNHGIVEGFGLVEKCGDSACKINGTSVTKIVV